MRNKTIISAHTCLHLSVVMSSTNVLTFPIGRIGTRSTPSDKWQGVQLKSLLYSFHLKNILIPHLILKKKNFPLISSTIIKNINYINLMKENFISTFHKIQYFKTIQDTSVGVINHQSQWTCTITPPSNLWTYQV